MSRVPPVASRVGCPLAIADVARMHAFCLWEMATDRDTLLRVQRPGRRAIGNWLWRRGPRSHRGDCDGSVCTALQVHLQKDRDPSHDEQSTEAAHFPESF